MDMGLSENGGIPPIFGLVLVGHTWKTWCFFCRALGLPPIFETDDIKVFGPFPAILCNDNAWTFDQGTPTHNSFMSILHRDWEIRLESAKCVREFVPVAWDVRHQSEHLNTPHD